MQFKLSSQLAMQLVDYDATQKHFKTQELKQAKNTTKARYTLGNVNDLIPFDIVGQAQQQEAVDHINTSIIPHRYKVFKSGANNKTVAILYHYESLWIAAWLPQHNEDYIIGIAYAYKNTKSIKDRMLTRITNLDSISVKYGRTEFCVHKKLLTIETIKEEYPSSTAFLLAYQHMHLQAYKTKSERIYKNCTSVFREALQSSLLLFTDDTLPMRRLYADNAANYLFDIKNKIELDNGKLTLKNLIDYMTTYTLNAYNFQAVESIQKLPQIFDTPFFRKYIQRQLDEAQQNFLDPKNTSQKNVIKPWTQVKNVVAAIKTIHSIWPNCPLDYYQQHLDLFIRFDINTCISSSYSVLNDINTQAMQWLGANMPVTSFFNIIKTYADENRQRDLDRQEVIYMLKDSMIMLQAILDAYETTKQTLSKPRRWRLEEMHDHFMALSWAIKNKKTMLKQSLFPDPVKVRDEHDNLYTFFQPCDTHQLAAWGKAVRNCVGNGNTYADGINKNKHFIVLGMINNNPCFTIQLSLDCGVLTVKQIVSLSNRCLSDVEQHKYNTMFQQALQAREATLISG